MAKAARRRSHTQIGSSDTSAHSPDSASSPSEQLEVLARGAVDTAKTARRHNKSLSGDNFYANMLATLRADATNVLRSFRLSTVGDISALAELIEHVFSPSSDSKARLKAYQELSYNLRTTWRATPSAREDEGLFPLSLLVKAKRGYLVTIGRQMNGSFTSGWHDAAAVMMRRLVEISIIEAFESKNVAANIKDASGDYLHLTDLITAALRESAWTLSRNAKKALPGLRDIGHMSAHGRYFTARQEDLESARPGCRVVVEEFLHHAGLI